MATIKKAKNGLKEPNNPGLKQLPTPVRNKMGFKKNGGAMKAKMGASIKKAANGTTTTKTTVKPVVDVKSGMNSAREVINGMQTISSPQKTTKPTRPTTPPPMNNLPPEEAKRRYMRPADTSPERFPTSGVSSNVTAKRGKTIKKAQNGTVQSANQQTQSNVNKIAMKNAGDSIKKSMAGNAKNGKSMKKCRYGCK
jgi:hypothetical protein